ncbi:hypothetical protein AMS68_003128 [Peltaster fructicola]|uniref:Uncharacterized protein n=1 Tax=Peltaster fructicola TaxID=286661 RepID=A0A6H0XSH5_9PEZI|nr:hypothetical protein AMS68_003128 [Peltaster fructicola]
MADITVLTQFNDLSIYNAGTLRTTFSGFTRVGTVVLFLYTTFTFAPVFVFDSALPTLMAPVIVLASAVPMAFSAVLAAPFVSTVRVRVPKEARKSVDSVVRYVRRLPPDTKVTFQTMRWLPWPVKSVVRFDELRRIDARKSHSANLAILPAGDVKAKQREQLEGSPLLAGLMKRMYSRLWVDREQAQDRSSAPGVLDIIWEQIPFAETETRKEIQPVAKTSVDSRKMISSKTNLELAAKKSTQPKLASRPRIAAPPPPSKYMGR